MDDAVRILGDGPLDISGSIGITNLTSMTEAIQALHAQSQPLSGPDLQRNFSSIDEAAQRPDNLSHAAHKTEATTSEEQLPVQDIGLVKQQLNTFTCFGMLPIELRTIIWRQSFPRRRKVYVYTCKDGNNWRDRALSYRSGQPPPAAFRVNRESRDVGLKHYRVLLQDAHDPRRRKYIHPGLDTVVLEGLDSLDDRSILISRSSAHLSKAFGDMQSLGLHGLRWNDRNTSAFGPNDDGADLDNLYCVKIKRALFVPGYVKRLHELFLFAETPHPSSTYGTFSRTNIKACSDSIRHFLTTKSEANPTYHVPEVHIVAPNGLFGMEIVDLTSDDEQVEVEYEELDEEYDEDYDGEDDGSSKVIDLCDSDAGDEADA
jgi:2EXR family